MSDTFTCEVCGQVDPPFVWADYSGEGMCVICGCPYQLKWGTDEQKAEGGYPYLNLKQEWADALSEYHEETGEYVCMGRVMPDRDRPNREVFIEWVKENRPELLEDDNEN